MVLKNGDTFVKLKNPYTFGVPVRGEDKFFGREEELQLIFDTLENVPRGQKQDIVVLGPRRIGKSSLLYRLVDLLTPIEDFVPVYVDVQNIKPRKTRILFFKILQKIREGYDKKSLLAKLPAFESLESSSIPADLEFLTFDEDMSRLNEVIEAQNLPRLVLMFDEVELLLEFGGKDTLDWFRSLIQSMLYTTFIVAGSEQLYSLTQDYGSPFYNIFKTVELYPLTTDAARRLVLVPAAEIGMEIAPNEVNKILRYAGNNPYFIQGLAHYLVEGLNRRKRHQVLPKDVDEVIEQGIEHLSAQFAYVWGGTSQVQKIILYSLAKRRRPQTTDALIANLPQSEPFILSKQAQKDTFDDLVRQQILKEDNYRYWFIVLLFPDWILSKMDDEDVIKLATVSETIQTRTYYNLKNIRTLLTEGFTSEELRALTFDEPNFRPVFDQMSASSGKAEIVDRLLQYADQQLLIDQLLIHAKKRNPARYEYYQPYRLKK